MDIASFQLRAGDLLLICSDGLTAVLPDDDINTFLARPLELEALAAALVEEANNRGGPDNITAVLIQMTGAPHIPRRPRSANAGEVAVPRSHHFNVKLIISLALVLIVAFGALAGILLYARNHYYYVGIDVRGDIALYQGVRWRPLGMGLSSLLESSGVSAGDLPDRDRVDLEEGKVLNRQEAEQAYEWYAGVASSHRRVPDVVGASLAEATERLLGAGLRPAHDPAAPPTSEVIAQEPEPDTIVEAGSQVALQVR